ncbi:hypothetical protein HMH01_11310 [Halovulum dunhuangense]|uniref:Uncharacterized protein n=1 Tax=Halovulum dunhuangense TaxID=1505036 RepID=A0A849L3W6_9RHOB|nr:hypothetical protein [Halovulum dunhuangense]NNU81025.1 hypothetical protein [Halovulum dunhuangense]
MSSMERVVEDLGRIYGRSKDFVGEFLYAPFGIESTDAVNAATLYVALAVLAMVTWRLASPAPRRRSGRARSKFDVSRNI